MVKVKLRYTVAVLAVGLGVNALAAADLRGVVRNGTTGKPAAGDAVLLLSPAKGMTEIGRGKTDASGRVRFAVAGTPGPLLVRVVHQGVAYGAMAPPGVNSFVVQVYDVARKLDGVSATQHVQRLQTEGDTLQAVEEIAVRNASNPPRTLMNDRPLEIQLPPGAEVLTGRVQLGGGRPLTRKPSPGDRTGHYYFPFPLYPGDTRFAVAYLLPYRGEAVIEPKILYPLKQFRVELPKSMQFEAKTPGMFEPMPGQTGTNVQVAAAVTPGQSLAFRVSGTGTVAGGLQSGQRQARSGIEVRTGPAVGAATESREPLHSYRWFVLGGLGLVLAAGAAGFLGQRRRRLSVSRTW